MNVDLRSRPTPAVRSAAPDDPVVAATWQRLQEAGGVASPFQSWEWFAALAGTMGAADLRVLVVDDGTGPIGLMPYEATIDHRGLRVVQTPGAHWLAPDHVDIVAAPQDRHRAADLAAAHLAELRAYDAVDVDGLRDGALHRALDTHLRRPRHIRLSEHPAVLPFVDLAARPPDRLLSRNSRKQTRRALRDAEREGGGFEVHTDPDAVTSHLPEMMDLHDARFGDVSGLYTGPARRDFHLRVAATLAARGHVRLYRLAGRGHSHALLYALVWGDHALAYGGGIRPTGGTPGHAVTALALMAAADEGLAVFDLLRGDSDWKRRFATGEVRNLQVRRLAVTPGALTRSTLWLARRTVRRARDVRRGS